MDYLPLFLKLNQHQCLLVGGGEIALRKADLLVQAGASLKVVAPLISDRLRKLLTDPRHTLLERPFRKPDVRGMALVVSATNNQKVNQRVADAAMQHNIPVNVVDDVALSTVIFPAIVDRSPLVLAVSSGGASPVVTRQVRELLETLVPGGHANLTRYLGERRPDLKLAYPDPDIRRRVTEAFLDSPGASLASRGEWEQADTYLKDMAKHANRTGEVYLVGAGPGDPDLLTLKALQLMQKADIVLYDNLVSEGVLARTRRDAEKRYVGKKGGAESTQQETINDLLLRLASEGHRVLRLKGGDPFIFGRGGEEIEPLVAAGIPFQVVPGITAASGCAAYAGIPLTHRDYSQSVRFVTGHPKNGQVDLNWQEFAHKNQTIVFYMGLGGLKPICEALIAHGRAVETPVAIISKGTLPDQKIVVGDLRTIGELASKAGLSRPTLIIIGEVVALYDRLNQPADGKSLESN